MTDPGIETPRIRLRCWQAADRDAFAAMNSHPEVMHDLGGPISRKQNDAKLDRFVAAFAERGFCRWLMESRDGKFLGYAGVMPSGAGHPLGFHYDIGWRLEGRFHARGSDRGAVLYGSREHPIAGCDVQVGPQPSAISRLHAPPRGHRTLARPGLDRPKRPVSWRESRPALRAHPAPE
jgi:hypothetical protein